MTVQDWQTFWTVLDSQTGEHNADPATAHNACFAPLSERAILAVHGPDSAKFLQGQLTCDLDKISAHQSSLGAACTPQGRMYSSFRLMSKAGAEPEFWLRMHRDLVSSTSASLSKYIPFFKAKLRDKRDELVGFGLWGGDAIAPLQACFGVVPQQLHEVAQLEGGVLVKAAENPARFECWLPPGLALEAAKLLSDTLRPRPYSAWLLHEIQAGEAYVAPATAEEFLPQMFDYDHTGAVSFNKGCYTGQEIVARTHYRGQAKRCLIRGRTAATPTLQPGDRLGSGTQVLTLVAAALEDAKSQQVLLVAPLDLLDAEQLRLTHQDSNLDLQLLPLRR